MFYVGSKNSGGELGGIGRALGPLLGNEDHPDPGATPINQFVQTMYGLTPADVWTAVELLTPIASRQLKLIA